MYFFYIFFWVHAVEHVEVRISTKIQTFAEVSHKTDVRRTSTSSPVLQVRGQEIPETLAASPTRQLPLAPDWSACQRGSSGLVGTAAGGFFSGGLMTGSVVAAAAGKEEDLLLQFSPKKRRVRMFSCFLY